MIRAEIARDEDTDLDRVVARKRLRPRGPTPAPQRDADVREEEKSEGYRAPARYDAPARLVALALKESAGRRFCGPRPDQIRPMAPTLDSPADLDLVRSTDAAVRIARHGRSGFWVRGTASGSPTARRSGGPRQASAAFGIDHTIYRLTLQGGETAREIATQLAAKVPAPYRARVRVLEDASAVVEVL